MPMYKAVIINILTFMIIRIIERDEDDRPRVLSMNGSM